jgi:hypothetical protein
MAASDHDTALLKIGEQARLPEICCSCDSVTRRTVTIRRSAAAPDETRPPDGSEELSSRLLHRTGLLGFAAWVITAILDGSGRGKIKVAVRLRQCRECARKLRVVPVHVDYDYYRMVFPVTRRFAEQFAQLNPGAEYGLAKTVPHGGASATKA